MEVWLVERAVFVEAWDGIRHGHANGVLLQRLCGLGLRSMARPGHETKGGSLTLAHLMCAHIWSIFCWRSYYWHGVASSIEMIPVDSATGISRFVA